MKQQKQLERRGFSLVEITISLVLLAILVLFSLQVVATSSTAAKTSDAKARAVRDTDALLRRLASELSQSTTRIDPGLPPEEAQRLWVMKDGVRFQRVVGYELDTQGEALQAWSAPIRYQWDAGESVIVRSTGGTDLKVVARNVTKFETAVNGNGQVVVAIEIAVGSAGCGTRASHRNTIRVTPRNDLR